MALHLYRRNKIKLSTRGRVLRSTGNRNDTNHAIHLASLPPNPNDIKAAHKPQASYSHADFKDAYSKALKDAYHLRVPPIVNLVIHDPQQDKLDMEIKKSLDCRAERNKAVTELDSMKKHSAAQQRPLAASQKKVEDLETELSNLQLATKATDSERKKEFEKEMDGLKAEHARELLEKLAEVAKYKAIADQSTSQQPTQPSNQEVVPQEQNQPKSLFAQSKKFRIQIRRVKLREALVAHLRKVEHKWAKKVRKIEAKSEKELKEAYAKIDELQRQLDQQAKAQGGLGSKRQRTS